MKTSIKFRTACIAALCLLMLYSCADMHYIEREMKTIYTYHNTSSNPIVITMRDDNYVKENFRIPIGGSKEMVYRGYMISTPFNKYNQLEISNGKVIITQRKFDSNIELGSLYKSTSYEYTPLIGEIVRYDYTFTDDFFKDGTPIEED